MTLHQSDRSCTILVGGDVCPTSADMAAFCEGDAVAIFHDLLDEFRGANLSLVNLECPLIEGGAPISKSGPALKAPTACIRTIKNAGIGAVNLANNHILDYGAAGLQSTLQAAKDEGIAAFGAGRNLAQARQFFTTTLNGIRIAVLGVAEHEFSIAAHESWGANPLDLIDFTRNVAAHRDSFDYLIVLLHGGNEGYPLPSPRLMDTCRFLIEQGANAILCQHSHCPGCYEEYRGGHIVYGQGNLVFHHGRTGQSWTEGFLVTLVIDSEKTRMEIVPFVQSRDRIGARRMVGASADSFLRQLADRSSQIQDPEFVARQWYDFCSGKENAYLSMLLGHGRLLRRLNRRGRVVRRLYSSNALLTAENVVRCEAHRDVLKTIFSMRKDRHMAGRNTTASTKSDKTS